MYICKKRVRSNLTNSRWTEALSRCCTIPCFRWLSIRIIHTRPSTLAAILPTAIFILLTLSLLNTLPTIHYLTPDIILRSTTITILPPAFSIRVFRATRTGTRIRAIDVCSERRTRRELPNAVYFPSFDEELS